MIFEDLIDTDYDDYLLKDPEAMEARLEHPVLKEGALIEAAKRYADKGLIPIALSHPNGLEKSAGKSPIKRDWNIRKSPTNDAEYDFKEAGNIGLLCGRHSNLTVIDIDCKIKGVVEFIFHNLNITDFVISSHTDNRFHVYFQHCEILPAGQYQALGFDILSGSIDKDGRTIGSNCVAPPSTHPGDGKLYKFNKDPSERTIIPASLRDNILYILKYYKEVKEISLKCRPWIRLAMTAMFENKNHPLYHNSSIFHTSTEGRNRALNFLGEFKKNGLSDEGLMLLCILMYGDTYDQTTSAKELGHVHPIPPKMETLMNDTYFSEFAKTQTENKVNREKGSSGGSEKKSVAVYFDEVADVLMKECRIFSMEDNGRIYIYKDGFYQNEGAETFLKQRAKDIYSSIYLKKCAELGAEPDHIPTASIKDCEEILDHIKTLKAMFRKQVEDNPDYKYLINLNNGILNFKTGEFVEHSAENSSQFLITRRIPVTYNVNATCPNFMNFLADITDPEKKETILEFMGYCLIPDTKIQQSFLFYGEGSNGKSILLKLFRLFFGSDNCSAIELQQLTADRFAAAQLHGKLINIYPDMGDSEIKDTGKFKALTSGDTINAQNKFERPFSFTNYARQVFSVNKFPYTRDQTFAFFRRMNLIEFPYKFVPNPDYKNGEKKEDPDILSKISTDSELSGILNIIVKCARHMLDEGHYSNSESVEDVATKYIMKSDPVAAFANRYIEPAEWGIPKMELFEAFERWARYNNVTGITVAKFSKRMKGLGYIDIRPWTSGEGAGPRMWDGIKLVDDFDKDIPTKIDEKQKAMSDYRPEKPKNKQYWETVYTQPAEAQA